MNSHILTIDGFMIRLFGLPYLRLTRDTLIHERCRYLLTIAHQVGKSGLRVLDVGCGSGLALYYLERFCQSGVRSYVGIDMNAQRLPKRWDFVKLPHCFRQVDLDDEWELGLFDLIWCSEVMEHMINDERLFHKMACHLTECGRLVITTPSRAFVERMTQTIPEFGKVSPIQDGGHVRKGYQVGDFEKMAHGNDLRIVSRAWLCPCSEAQLRIRSRANFGAKLGRLLMSVTTRSVSSAGRMPRRCPESCFSLGVSLAKGRKQDVSIASKIRAEAPNDAIATLNYSSAG